MAYYIRSDGDSTWPGARTSQESDAGVHGNAVNPCGELAVTPIARETLPKIQHHLLKQIIQLILVVGIDVAHFVYDPFLCRDQLQEIVFYLFRVHVLLNRLPY